MILLQTIAQTLRIATPIVATGTHEYLTARAEFRGQAWRDAIKYVNFEMGPFHYRILLHEDEITEEQRLDLTAGTWTVWIEGYHYDRENNVITQKITTATALLEVVDLNGDMSWPEFTPEISELLAVEVADAVETAHSIEERADAGDFDGATFTPDVDDEGNISWTNDRGKENPETKNIRGPVGDSGVWIGEEAPEDESYKVWIQPTGDGAFALTGIELISGSHLPGTYDTYRLTKTDGTYLDVQVYNGADGSGVGDMVASLYDPQNKRTDIFEYADEAAADAAGEVSESLAEVATSGAYADLTGKPPERFFFVEYGETTYEEAVEAWNHYRKVPLMIDGLQRFVMIGRVTINGQPGSQTYTFGFVPFWGYYTFPVYYLDENGWRTEQYSSEVFFGLSTVAKSGAYADLTGKPVIDGAVTQGSQNAVTSAGIYSAIQAAKTTVDSALSSSSENPVQNKVVKAAIDGIRIPVDSALSSVSENPVQNKVVKAALGSLITTREFVTTKEYQPSYGNAGYIVINPTLSGYTPIGILACHIGPNSLEDGLNFSGKFQFLGTGILSSTQYGAYVEHFQLESSVTVKMTIKILYIKNGI